MLITFISNTPEDVNLFYQPLLADGISHLDAEESRHCVKVLRKKTGDEILVTDGKGYFYTCRITSTALHQCDFEVSEKRREEPAPHFIHIAVSPTKNSDRIEWFVEKAVELGIHEITLVDCQNTERTFVKTERLLKVAISAMKQSLKASVPEINHLTPLTSLIAQSGNVNKFIAYVDSSNPVHLKDAVLPEKRTLVLIGPEGDFSKDELNIALANGFVKVSLGKSRLRTETAALQACSILNLRCNS